MIRWLPKQRYGPLGVDVGSRSVKLVQFNGDGSRLVDAARWDLAPDEAADPQSPDYVGQMAAAISHAREGRGFRGHRAVLCLSDRDLFLQNLRVPKTPGADMERLVQKEAAGRVPFSMAEAEIRYFETTDVRQGDAMLREVILLACHRPVLQRALRVVEEAGLEPAAVDIEPAALLRGYFKQLRRDEDRRRRSLFVHVGHAKTVVVIARGDEALFVKYIDVGGRHMDEAVARHLAMGPAEATALRRHNGDRRADQQDPEIAESIAKAVRPVVERLAGELSMCVRYHSVTFRGQSLEQLVLGGGEATPTLLEALARKLDLTCELGDPLRSYSTKAHAARRGQWDIAAGLALKELSGTP